MAKNMFEVRYQRQGQWKGRLRRGCQRRPGKSAWRQRSCFVLVRVAPGALPQADRNAVPLALNDAVVLRRGHEHLPLTRGGGGVNSRRDRSEETENSGGGAFRHHRRSKLVNGDAVHLRHRARVSTLRRETHRALAGGGKDQVSQRGCAFLREDFER